MLRCLQTKAVRGTNAQAQTRAEHGMQDRRYHLSAIRRRTPPCVVTLKRRRALRLGQQQQRVCQQRQKCKEQSRAQSILYFRQPLGYTSLLPQAFALWHHISFTHCTFSRLTTSTRLTTIKDCTASLRRLPASKTQLQGT